jgi:hypothetical protein
MRLSEDSRLGDADRRKRSFQDQVLSWASGSSPSLSDLGLSHCCSFGTLLGLSFARFCEPLRLSPHEQSSLGHRYTSAQGYMRFHSPSIDRSLLRSLFLDLFTCEFQYRAFWPAPVFRLFRKLSEEIDNELISGASDASHDFPSFLRRRLQTILSGMTKLVVGNHALPGESFSRRMVDYPSLVARRVDSRVFRH